MSNNAGEYIHDVFIKKIIGNKLRDEADIHEFMDFLEGLNEEEKKRIAPCDLAQLYLGIGNFYYERIRIEKACEFYNKVIETRCPRSFINRDVYFRLGKIQFEQMKFKEAVVNFVSVLSFDRDNREIIKYIEECLKKLNISKYKNRFLSLGPKEAKKLIMEIL